MRIASPVAGYAGHRPSISESACAPVRHSSPVTGYAGHRPSVSEQACAPVRIASPVVGYAGHRPSSRTQAPAPASPPSFRSLRPNADSSPRFETGSRCLSLEAQARQVLGVHTPSRAAQPSPRAAAQRAPRTETDSRMDSRRLSLEAQARRRLSYATAETTSASSRLSLDSEWRTPRMLGARARSCAASAVLVC